MITARQAGKITQYWNKHAVGNKHFLSARRAAVSLIFATALIPLLMIVGLSIDYGLYNEAHSQLDMAADASVLHAARVAAQLMQKGDTRYLQKGTFAGQQWFTGQLGSVPQAHSANFSPDIVVTSVNNQITATMTYHGVITANFGRLFPGSWPAYPNWNIVGNATAVVSIPSYVEVLMLLDNSSSMLIAADPDGISTMDSLTPCSLQAATQGQNFDYNYSWAFTPVNGTYISETPASAYSTVAAFNAAIDPKTAAPIRLPYGYGTFIYPSKTGTVLTQPEIPPPPSKVGQCDARFTGAAYGIPCNYPGPGLSPYIAPITAPHPGACTNGGGGAGSLVYYPGTPTQQALKGIPNMPQAPCAFACHTTADNTDYYGLARSNNITLRYDVLQAAAANVIASMSQAQSVAQLSVGVYQYNAPLTTSDQPQGLKEVYPAATDTNTFAAAEVGPVTEQAQTLTQSVVPPITGDQPDTNFSNAMTLLGHFVRPAGLGLSPATAKKYLFIVTDGLDDYYPNPSSPTGRIQGPITPAACDQLKTPVGTNTAAGLPGRGFTLYVLYTQYYPLANPFYLNNDKATVEGTSAATGSTPLKDAMRSCASNPDNFYEAGSGKNDIDTALQAMLAAALGSADRIAD